MQKHENLKKILDALYVIASEKAIAVLFSMVAQEISTNPNWVD